MRTGQTNSWQLNQLQSSKNKLGLYHWAPPRTGSYEYEQQMADGQLFLRQDNMGEDKSRTSAKSHNLDLTGQMETDTDLHSTIIIFSAITTFITKSAGESEHWKIIESLHNLWLLHDDQVWLMPHVKTIKNIISCTILEFQTILMLYVKIANLLEYRHTIKA
jgi:hypothetical protein